MAFNVGVARPVPLFAGPSMKLPDVQPMFSIVVPVWNPVLVEFEEMLDSVFAQDDGDWQLVLAADGPQRADVSALLDGVSARGQEGRTGAKSRVLVIHRETQGGIVAATNDALAAATGEFVVFADNDDMLAHNAISSFRQAVLANDDVDVVYSDEDKIDVNGRRKDPFFKPAWSPDRLRSQMYLGHLCAFRRTLVAEVGSLREEYNGSQDYDLALRVTEQARRITHVPQILYHWRQSANSTALDPSNKDWAFEAGVRAVQSQLDRLEIPAVAIRDAERVGVHDISPRLLDFPLVSIIILTGGSSRVVRGETVVMVTNAIESIVSKSTYPNYEILVVIDAKSDDTLRKELLELAPLHVRVIQDQRPFSFSASNNFGATYAYGDHLIFLNDDTEVLTPDWIERLVLFSSLPGAGAVGCQLLFPNGTIQHAGVFAQFGEVGHRFYGFAADTDPAFHSLGLTMNSLCVTAACLAIHRDAFQEVGGFCVELPLNFNDVDLCMKLANAGYRNVLDNRTVLEHLETSSRPAGVEGWEVEHMVSRWEGYLHNDPWHSPHTVGGAGETVPAPVSLALRKDVTGTAPAARSWPDLHQGI